MCRLNARKSCESNRTEIEDRKLGFVVLWLGGAVWGDCDVECYLCGRDPLTGKDFEYRRKWSRDRLEHLASIFAIDCLTYAIMSNQAHQILRSRPDIAAT